MVADRLCGSIPITTLPIHALLSSTSEPCGRRRRAALSRAGQSPLEPLLVTVPGETHARVEPHQPAVGSRCESDPAGHLGDSLARPPPSVESEIAAMWAGRATPAALRPRRRPTR